MSSRQLSSFRICARFITIVQLLFAQMKHAYTLDRASRRRTEAIYDIRLDWMVIGTEIKHDRCFLWMGGQTALPADAGDTNCVDKIIYTISGGYRQTAQTLANAGFVLL